MKIKLYDFLIFSISLLALFLPLLRFLNYFFLSLFSYPDYAGSGLKTFLIMNSPKIFGVVVAIVALALARHINNQLLKDLARIISILVIASAFLWFISFCLFFVFLKTSTYTS